MSLVSFQLKILNFRVDNFRYSKVTLLYAGHAWNGSSESPRKCIFVFHENGSFHVDYFYVIYSLYNIELYFPIIQSHKKSQMAYLASFAEKCCWNWNRIRMIWQIDQRLSSFDFRYSNRWPDENTDFQGSWKYTQKA